MNPPCMFGYFATTGVLAFLPRAAEISYLQWVQTIAFFYAGDFSEETKNSVGFHYEHNNTCCECLNELDNPQSAAQND